VRVRRRLSKVGGIRLYPSGAWSDIRELASVWTVLLPDWSIFARAEQLLQRYRLSFWDAMIVAACLIGGVDRLYSEDFSAYKSLDSLEIVNPFETP
jgi:predicted nucleic acid-binding protein